MYWQVTNTNVRVLGSMHLLPENNTGLPKWAVQAFEWAELLVFESDPQAIVPYFKASSPQSLRNELKPASFETLCSLWPKSETFPQIEDVRPWVVFLLSSALTQRVTLGVEPQFIKWALEQSKQVEFLERGEDVVAAFDSAPASEIYEALEMFVADLTEPQRSLEGMYAAWMRCDLQSLFNVARQSPTFRFAGIKQALLERRNREWAPHLRQLGDRRERTLIAVGALHLHGPGNAMEHAGWDVQLVPTDG
jgi:uncharacterized protein